MYLRLRKLTLLVSLVVLFILTGCDTTNISNRIIGKVNSKIDGSPIGNAEVDIYRSEKKCGMSYSSYWKTIYNVDNGNYSFDYDIEFRYRVCANNNEMKSPFVDIMTPDSEEEKVSISAQNLELYNNSDNSTIDFSITIQEMNTDVDSISVVLQRIEQDSLIVVDSLFTDLSNDYSFENVPTGNYQVKMEKENVYSCKSDSYFIDGISEVNKTFIFAMINGITNN